MDFFQNQDRARQNTNLLVLYYALAVVLIVLAVYLAVSAILFGASVSSEPRTGGHEMWDPQRFGIVVALTLAVILSGTVYRVMTLSAGGSTVARMLGGRPVDPNTSDPAERRLLNIVEEMAIASGIPVPRVYLLDAENGINAFAAGFTTNDAVVAVTRGCLSVLSRDELQGVIGHEFSHILNGDMRLNIRLMGVLNGILVIALVGYYIFRVMFRSSGRVRTRSKKGGGGAALAILLLGLALMAIGYIGVFFARLIQSAISRQREFLADASAVQYTRNPDGIAGALKRIGGYLAGSRMESPKAMEASHLFFANGLAHSWLSLMATHPPLEERIRRIDPGFDGVFPAARETARAADEATGTAGAAAAAVPGVSGFAIEPGEVVSRVGTPRDAHLAYASALVASLPEELTQTIRIPSRAASVLLALLLDRDAARREAQLRVLAGKKDPLIRREVSRIAPLVDKIGPEARLPLVDLALPALRMLSKAQYQDFRQTVEELVVADNEINLFEYVLHRTLLRRLDPVFLGTRPPAIRYRDLKPLTPACVNLLSALAHFGSDSEAAAAQAFARGMRTLDPALAASPIAPPDQAALQAVDQALAVLAQASPPLKKRVIAACAGCVGADGRVTVEEAEALRAAADALDCPLPPFLPAAAA